MWAACSLTGHSVPALLDFEIFLEYNTLVPINVLTMIYKPHKPLPRPQVGRECPLWGQESSSENFHLSLVIGSQKYFDNIKTLDTSSCGLHVV